MAQFDNLNDHCLLEVLDLLSPDDLFTMFRVNRRLKRLTAEKMRDKIKAIRLKVNQWKPSINSHLGVIGPDQELNLEPMFKKRDVTEAFGDPSIRARFLDVLTVCAGIKSIDLSNYLFPDGYLLEVVQRCPEIDCIALAIGYIEKEELEQVMNQIGHKLVHIVNNGLCQEMPEARVLAMIAEKCPDIKQLDWWANQYLTSDLLAAFKLLPKSCWIKLKCSELKVFEDVVDELELFRLNWSLLGHRLVRLSSLDFQIRLGPVRGVNFTNLKKLEYVPAKAFCDEKEFRILSFSRFPRLEEFCFNASCGLTGDDYEKLFQRMRSVKKLTIICDWSSNSHPPEHLPGSSILQLNNLDTIDVKLWYILEDFKPKKFLKQLEQYVDDIRSLKKLSVKLLWRSDHEWEKTLENEIKRMKMEQNRVEVDWIIQNQIIKLPVN